MSFKASDNPSLSTDVNGVITGDSIKVQFPRNSTLNNLIPTFNFSGKSISPANKTAQSFSGPVSYTIYAEDGTSRIYTLSSSVQLSDTNILILSKWNVVKDSLDDSPNFFYVDQSGATGHPTAGVYIGNSSDYYTFNSNGIVTISENGITGNSNYVITPSNKIYINVFNAYDSATIETLNASNFVFFWTKTSPNGGTYYRKLTLKK